MKTAFQVMVRAGKIESKKHKIKSKKMVSNEEKNEGGGMFASLTGKKKPANDDEEEESGTDVIGAGIDSVMIFYF
jgi:hypothetical protein